ncbi:delta-aminolevulinic acid dehydratase [Sitodiplosis mosellana]|uniref:delta-aminolevulinic acid dehydratase n=1 Tax=Sitodiplosis mosellana TaxID=263140 RepID=UPI002444B2D1|nr:delta-aminolevulinic acid dehydratase [Sitodiplosis mosellana]
MAAAKKFHSSLFHPTLRKWQEGNVNIEPENLMYPLFLIEKDDAIEEITSMPGVSRFGVNQVVKHLEPLVEKGLKTVLLFGVIETLPKNSRGSSADCAENPVVRALPLLRKNFPDLLLATDVCICPYTSHGHCGIFDEENHMDNEVSIQRLAEISLAYAIAGAHIIAPSDMMDNRIGAIKSILRKNRLESRVSVLSYAVKFASSFYGPFRDAARSAPAYGDRKCYQLPVGSKGIAARAAERDVEEGADMLMVKPGMAYLDIVRQTKDMYPHLPLFIYQVSGEYAMLWHGAKNGAFNLNAIVMETLTSMRRAGADVLITYYTPLVLDLIQKK